MEMSEAILLGSVGSGQALGKLMDDDGNTCAFGSAYFAIGVSDESLKLGHLNPLELRKVLDQDWIVQGDKVVNSECPVCGIKRGIGRIISLHLNDLHKWTRPAIAAWVAIQEQEYNNTRRKTCVEPTTCGNQSLKTLQEEVAPTGGQSLDCSSSLLPVV